MLHLYIPVPSFQIFYESFPVTFCVPTPLSSATLWLSCTSLCTRFLPYSGLGPPVHLDKRPLLPASTARTFSHCLAALNLLPRSLTAPAALRHNPVSFTSSPIRLSHFCCPWCCQHSWQPLWVCHSRIRPSSVILLTTPPPPVGLNLWTSPCRYQGRVCL